MDLRPLTYEEMCQMELMHTGSNCGGIGGVSVVGGTSTNPSASLALTSQTTMAAVASSAASQNSNTSTTTTMLPIMVIPTTMMPPGTHLITTTPGAAAAAVAAANAATTLQEAEYDADSHQQQQQLTLSAAQPTHFYQLQPTHILATATPSNTEFTLSSAPTATLLLQPTAQLATTATSSGATTEQLPHTHSILQQQQQIPQQTVNILYTGTLTKTPQQHNTSTIPLTRSALECSTLPRNFQAKSLNPSLNANQDESDFEGSECGASVSTTTCIPHFRFGGCGVILQPAQNFTQQQQQQQQQQPPQHHGEPQVIGCASLSHMMGSFASAAGDAMHTGSRNLAGTLGRNRRAQQQQQQQDGLVTQTPKRVSFKGVDLPPPPSQEELQMLDAANHGPNMDTFNNCSYMNFDNFMDYQNNFENIFRHDSLNGHYNDPHEPTNNSINNKTNYNRINRNNNFENIFRHDSLNGHYNDPHEPTNNSINNKTNYNRINRNTTGFGGLPDVTEHSNIRRTISRQNSTSNSDSGGEISSIQKSKVNFNDTKSPSDATETTSVDAATKTKRKSKGSQQQHHHNSHHHLHHNRHRHGGGGSDNAQHKLGRSSCVIVLTLIVALGLLAVAATLLYQHFVMAPSRNSHTQRLKIVTRILREVPLVDGHNNFAWNVRKYAHSSLELVHVSNDINHKSMWVRPAWAQTDMERLKQGHVGVQVWSAYVPCEAQGLDAVQLALEQIDIIRRLTDMYQQDTVLVQSSADIQMAQRHGLMASLIGIEGGHAIGSSLGVLRSFYSLGARYLSLTHKCDVSWASSSSSLIDTGLTQFGKAVVREMNRLGMMIDLSYSSDTTARDVLQATRAPVIFSHSGARQLCNSTRNVPDDILRLVAENGGLIMISFDSEDVTCGRQARLKDVVEHIKYIRAIAGIQHIGLGAGYDSIELPPIGLEDVSKYPDLLATLLEDPNWSEEDIAMLAGKNFLRIMETVENVREFWKRAAITPIEQTEPQPKTQCTYMSS